MRVIRKVYLFKSADIWFNPEPYLSGTDIPVRLDPNNPQRYFVDTSSLPEMGQEQGP